MQSADAMAVIAQFVLSSDDGSMDDDMSSRGMAAIRGGVLTVEIEGRDAVCTFSAS